MFKEVRVNVLMHELDGARHSRFECFLCCPQDREPSGMDPLEHIGRDRYHAAISFQLFDPMQPMVAFSCDTTVT